MKKFARNYLSYLQGQLAGLNLTRITDLEDFYNKQILDSILPQRLSQSFARDLIDADLVVDVGFGGGFPILPLAFCNSNLKFLGLEARNKKVEAVRQLARFLDINNVQLLHRRFQEIFFDRSVVIISKAVCKVTEFLEPLQFSSRIRVYFYKGPNFDQLEGEFGIPAGWEVCERMSYELEDGSKRLFLGFCPKIVPRGTILRDNSLVKLSELI